MNTTEAVVDAIWPWRAKDLAKPADPAGARRSRAFVQFCIMNIFASLVLVLSRCERLGLPAFLYVFSLVVLLAGYAVPKLFKALEDFGKLLARLVGAILTWTLLTVFYYICFVPGHLILKLKGKDPLQREWSKDKQSYWTDKKREEGVAGYTRQY